MKKSSLFCVFGLLVVLSLFVIYWPRESVDSDLVDSSAPVQSLERDDNQNAKVDAFKDRVQQVIQARPAAPVSREPNTYFDPGNRDPVYRKNYERHRQIVDFVNSPHRDHPENRRLMVLLLENGFDISDWSRVATAVSWINRRVVATREKVEKSSLSRAEMDEEMAVAYKFRRSGLSGFSKLIYQRGIEPGSDLFESLVSIELPYFGKAVFSDVVIRGDTFLTDEDWMDEEFQAAKDRYRGPVRDVSAAAHKRRKDEWYARDREQRAERRRERQQRNAETRRLLGME